MHSRCFQLATVRTHKLRPSDSTCPPVSYSRAACEMTGTGLCARVCGPYSFTNAVIEAVTICKRSRRWVRIWPRDVQAGRTRYSVYKWRARVLLGLRSL